MDTELHFSTGDDEHDTPLSFFAPIAKAVGGFDVDPAASPTSELADVNYTKEDDGLTQDWTGNVWLNPPYSDVSEWLDRVDTEMNTSRLDDSGPDLLVALVFARTSTRWFHNYATTADLLCFVKGRLKFGGAENSAPAPSLVGVWGDYPDELVEHLETVGFVVEPDA